MIYPVDVSDGMDVWINRIWRRPADSLAERTRRRVTLRLIPFLFFLYILAYLDRVNASVALLQMNASPAEGGLGFTSEIIGFGTALFFWGYWVLEIPSTITVARRGARWVFVRVLVLWGICATLLGSIGTPLAGRLLGWLPWVGDAPAQQFYVLQFLLGFFEGGFFPSVIVYLSYWFRTEDRAKAIAGFMAAIPLSGVIGTPISGLLLGVHWFGLAGWRWVFILEGVAPILAAGLTVIYLPNRPVDAKWLRTDERDWLQNELDREHQRKTMHGHFAWRQKIGAVLLLTAVYFGLNVASYGLGMFMPKMIKTQTSANEWVSWFLMASGMSRNLFASLLTGFASVLAFVAMQINGRHSDRTGERPWHAAVPLALWGLALGLAAILHFAPFWSALVVVACVGTFMFAHLPAFWPIPTTFLGATAAASAIGFINMVGNLGGGFGRYMVGTLADRGDNYLAALGFLAPWPIASAVLIIVAARFSRKATEVPTPACETAPVPTGATTQATPG